MREKVLFTVSWAHHAVIAKEQPSAAHVDKLSSHVPTLCRRPSRGRLARAPAIRATLGARAALPWPTLGVSLHAMTGVRPPHRIGSHSLLIATWTLVTAEERERNTTQTRRARRFHVLLLPCVAALYKSLLSQWFGSLRGAHVMH